MGTSPLPNFGLRTPPLGGAKCPDPLWGAGRSLYLSGPQTFLGGWQVLTASAVGQPAAPSPVPPIPPPPAVEGSVPYINIAAAEYTLHSVPDEPEGSTVWVDEL